VGTKRKRDELSPRQLRFVLEYLRTSNGTQAVKAAGYKCKSDAVAAVRAVEILRIPKVAKYLKALRRKLQERAEIKAENILRGLWEIAEDLSVAPSTRVSAYIGVGKFVGLDKLYIGRLEELMGKSFADLQPNEELPRPQIIEITLEEAPYEQLTTWVENTKPWFTGASMWIAETHEWLKGLEAITPGKEPLKELQEG
jgi:hypothetical protein